MFALTLLLVLAPVIAAVWVLSLARDILAG